MADTVNRAYTDLLAKVDLFTRLDRVALAAHLGPVLDAGGLDERGQLRQGDPADSLYIVPSGTFGVFAAPPVCHHETRLGTLAVGDWFCEMGLLTGDSRSATVPQKRAPAQRRVGGRPVLVHRGTCGS